MQKILKVSELKKSYGKNIAVDGITFDAYQGEMIAMLGPNGAGKSTVVSILSTFMPQDEGSVYIDGLALGKHNKKIRQKIGVVFQKGVLDEMLTVGQNLSLRASLYGLKGDTMRRQIKRIGEMTEITEIMSKPYGMLSGGQQRRCDIARALLHCPKLLFLDEPTAGLDPEIRLSLWNTIQEIRSKTAMTILLTTHYMDEAEKADRIIVMKKGKIAAEGTADSLRQQFVNNSSQLLNDNDVFLAYMLERAYLSIIGRD